MAALLVRHGVLRYDASTPPFYNVSRTDIRNSAMRSSLSVATVDAGS